MNASRFAVAGLALLLCACEGVGIVASDDPNVKLGQAEALYGQGRIMRAREQLDEAMPLLEQRGDKAGLAEAYRLYGFVAAAGGLNADPVIIRDPDAELKPNPAESDLAVRQFVRASELAAEANALDQLSNIYFILGSYRVLGGRKAEGCSYFDRSLAVGREAQRQHPDRRIQLPNNVKTLDELIATAKNQAGCA